MDGTMAVNQSAGAHPDEAVIPPVVEQSVAAPMLPLGRLHEVGDPGAQPVSSAEVAARIEAKVSRGPSPTELGDAAARALGASDVPEP